MMFGGQDPNISHVVYNLGCEGRAGWLSYLYVQTLRRLHVLCYVQSFLSSKRPHKSGQGLLVLVEPLQLHVGQKAM